MGRATPALVALLVVVSALAAFPVATSAQSDAQNETAAPGAQLAGTVAVQQAELDGAVETRAFGIQVAAANTSDAKAGVVAQRLSAVQQRVDELEQRERALQQARENGSISEREYRVRAAQLHAESGTAARLAAQSNETARGLPAETLEANGVNVSAIRTLSERASGLGGQEVAAIARSIAGPPEQGVPAAADRGPDRNRTGLDDPAADNPVETPGGEPVTADDPGNVTTGNETATDRQSGDDETRGNPGNGPNGTAGGDGDR